MLFRKAEKLRKELSDLMAKGSLGDNPILGEDVYGFEGPLHEWEKPEYDKFEVLRMFLNYNRRCQEKRFSNWPNDADGLLYFWLHFGGSRCEEYINGASFVYAKISELDDFREKKKILALLLEFKNLLNTDVDIF